MDTLIPNIYPIRKQTFRFLMLLYLYCLRWMYLLHFFGAYVALECSNTIELNGEGCDEEKDILLNFFAKG